MTILTIKWKFKSWLHHTAKATALQFSSVHRLKS